MTSLKLTFAFFLLLFVYTRPLSAQLSIDAQLRTRAEFRQGQGSPLSQGAPATGFISQRSRINARFNSNRLKTYFSLQDIRVWGQDVSTINRSTASEFNGLMLHEAWAEIRVNDTASLRHQLSFKIGRQELVYDDQRLIGNLDWLQQARRHDAAVLKYEKGPAAIHVGAAFSQNRERQSGTLYMATPPGEYATNTNGGGMYKSMQYLHATVPLLKSRISFLVFVDQFSRFNKMSVNDLEVKEFIPGAWSRFTSGFFLQRVREKYSVEASAYYQFGKNHSGESVGGYLMSAYAAMPLGKFTTGAGVDYTTRTFDPLYGTPHKFWGAMDYFYAGSGFGDNGLTDYFLRLRYRPTPRIALHADVHQFFSTKNIAGYSNRNFGQEVDLQASFSFAQNISLEAGFSRFFSTALLASDAVKNIDNAKSSANWAYLMLNIKPQLFSK